MPRREIFKLKLGIPSNINVRGIIIADANNIAEVISNLDIKIKVKVAEGEKKLFGSVTTIQFTDELASMGHEIDKRFVKLSTIKEVGKYEAEVRLHRNVRVTIPFEVIAE